MARFSIRLEEPLSAEKERSRHTGMGYPKTDTAFALVDEILLVQRIDDIKPDQELLSVPGQWNDMANRKVVDRISGAMARVSLCTFFCSPQSRCKENLPSEGCPIE